jgi:putative membrane protein
MSARDIGIVVLVVIGVLIVLPLLGGAGLMGPGMMGPGMMGPGMMGGRWGAGWMPFAGGLFWILIIVGAVLVVTALMRREAQPPAPGALEPPLDILKRRLAKGEISLEEYERLKQELA